MTQPAWGQPQLAPEPTPMPKKPPYAQKKVWIPSAALAILVALGIAGGSQDTTTMRAVGSGTGDSVAADQAAAEKLRAQAEADKAAAEKIAAQAAADKAAAEKQAAADKVAEDKAAVDKAAADQAAAEKKAAADASAAKAAAPAGDTVNFKMSNFVGGNLQVAQDAVQETGIFLSLSHDLIASRSQVLDANWQICTQTPAAGTTIRGPAADWEGKIDFGVVKVTESCP